MRKGESQPKRQITEKSWEKRKELQERSIGGCPNNFEMEGFNGTKRPVEFGEGKTMKERGELPNEKGDAVREYNAMHEENFWSNWFREDERGKEERTAKAENEEKKKSEKKNREEEKEENETVTVKKRCEGFVSVEASEIFSHG